MNVWASVKANLGVVVLVFAGCAADGPQQPATDSAAFRPATTPRPAPSRQEAEQRFSEGVAYARQGEIDGAITVFETLIQQYPNFPGPYNNLAVLYASRGHYDRARQVLLSAIEIQPSLDTPHENLGDVYSKLAATAYGRAFEINSANLRAHSKSELITRMLHTGTSRSETVSVGTAPPTIAQPDPRWHVGVTCYSVGPILHRVDAEAIAAWARLQGVRATTRGDAEDNPIAYYRIYLPPFPSQGDAEHTAETLIAAGLTDLEVVYEGPLKNAISLGVYKQEASARLRLDQLRELGVTPVLDVRRRERQRYVVEITGQGDNAWRTRFAQAFPDQTLQASDCAENSRASAER